MRSWDFGIYLENLLESPPVFGSVPLKEAGAPVHAYDMLGDVLAQELYALGQSCLCWSRLKNGVVMRKGYVMSKTPCTSTAGMGDIYKHCPNQLTYSSRRQRFRENLLPGGSAIAKRARRGRCNGIIAED
jgi:hypothetical protein